MAKKYSKKRLKPTIFLKKNRSGLSVIVTTLLIIVLSMAAVVIVWISVNSLVKNKMESSVSCYGNYDKIKINGMYTCFNKTSASNYDLLFSLSVGDVTVDKVLVSVSSGNAVTGYTITNTPQGINGLTMYPSGLAQISLPGKNSGLTYEITGFGYPIDSVQIAPYIGGNLCGVSDTISSIDDCSLLS
jgi:hypothetical protein